VQQVGEEGLRSRALLWPRRAEADEDRERLARFFFHKSGCSVKRIVATDICSSIFVPTDEVTDANEGLRNKLLAGVSSSGCSFVVAAVSSPSSPCSRCQG
jgi:hypothetical protein